MTQTQINLTGAEIFSLLSLLRHGDPKRYGPAFKTAEQKLKQAEKQNAKEQQIENTTSRNPTT